jgi:hypothetical protein
MELAEYGIVVVIADENGVLIESNSIAASTKPSIVDFLSQIRKFFDIC